jgi:hypothetical protein
MDLIVPFEFVSIINKESKASHQMVEDDALVRLYRGHSTPPQNSWVHHLYIFSAMFTVFTRLIY